MDLCNFKVAAAAALLTPSLVLGAPILQNDSDDASPQASAGLFSVGTNGLVSNSGFIDFIEADSRTGTTITYSSTVNGSLIDATFGGLVNGQTVDILTDANGDAGPGNIGIEAIRPLANGMGNPAAIDTGVANPFGFAENYGPRQGNGGFSEGPLTPYQNNTPGPVALAVDNNNMNDNVLEGYGVQGRPIDPNGTLINGFGAITVVFDELVSGFAGFVGSLEREGSVTLVTYLNDGSVYASVSSTLFSMMAGDDQYNLLSIEDSVGENIIRAATFYQELSDAAGFSLDYVQFEQSGPQLAIVPTPASLLLLVLGLAGFAVRRQAHS